MEPNHGIVVAKTISCDHRVPERSQDLENRPLRSRAISDPFLPPSPNGESGKLLDQRYRAGIFVASFSCRGETIGFRISPGRLYLFVSVTALVCSQVSLAVLSSATHNVANYGFRWNDYCEHVKKGTQRGWVWWQTRPLEHGALGVHGRNKGSGSAQEATRRFVDDAAGIGRIR